MKTLFSRDELEHYLHENLPLTQAIGIAVVEMTASYVKLGAPLHLNYNHMRSAFGGSLESLATVTAWSALFLELRRREVQAELVIRRCTMSFLRPVEADFTAIAAYPSADAWAAFLRSFTRKNLGRFEIACTIESSGALCARFEGEFAGVRATTGQQSEK